MPLACGGPDAVSNMQWQTIADARAKDTWGAEGMRPLMPILVSGAYCPARLFAILAGTTQARSEIECPKADGPI